MINGTNTFVSLYSIFTTDVLDPIRALTSDVLVAANLPLEFVLVIMLMVIGIGMILGRTTSDGVVNRLIRMAIVVSLIAQSGLYFHYVQGFFLTGIPNYISGHIINTFTGKYTTSLTSPGTGFDHALAVILGEAKIVTHSAPTGIDGIVPRLVVAFGEIVALSALAFLFAVFVIVQTVLGIVIVIGPIMVIGYLFDYTKRFTDGWLSALITLSLLTLVIDIVVLVLVSAIDTIFSDLDIVKGGNIAQNLQVWLGGLAGIVVIAMAVAVLPRVIEAIGGGVAVGLGLENSNRWLRGTPLFRPGSGLGRSSGGSGAGGGNARPSATSRIINRIRNRNKGDS